MQETVSGSGISWAICTSAVGCRKLSCAADSRGRWTRRVSGSRAFHSRGRGEYGRLPHKWASGSKFPLGTTTLAGVSRFCIKSGHLVHRQITKFVATGCQILRLKWTKFGWGSARDLNGGAYSLQEGGEMSHLCSWDERPCNWLRVSSVQFMCWKPACTQYNRIQNLLICEQPMKAILLGLRMCRCGQMIPWAGFHYNLFYIVLRNGPKVSELFSYSLTDIDNI